MKWPILSVFVLVFLAGSARVTADEVVASKISTITILPSAKKDFAYLWDRSIRKHAERLVCLSVSGNTITSASEYPGQFVDSVEVAPMGRFCSRGQGTAHSHIFGTENFSQPDSLMITTYNSEHHTGVHCILYSSQDILCLSPQGRSVRMRYR